MKYTPEQAVASLVKRGVPEHVARGVVRNFQDESGLESGIQEKDPTRGRGGFGFAQWTGPRRVALEDYATARRVSPDDPEMQFDFFMEENAGPEAAAWKAVMNSPTEQDAAVNFVSKWERPAEKHRLARVAKYQGSPSEGGAKFGGAGLGDPANPVPVTTPVAPEYPGGAPAPVARAAVDDRPGWKKALAGLASGGASAGGNVATPPMVPMETPKAVIAQAQPGMTIDPQQGLIQRQKLAEAMARLNAGKLWAG